MPQRRSAGVFAIAIALVLAACSAEASPTTTTTAPPPTTSQLPETAATALPTGPLPLPGSTVLKPGEYVTTVFEPRVQYRIERTHALAAFQYAEITGLENFGNGCTNCAALGTRPYRGIALNNWRHFATPEEIIAELETFEAIQFGLPTQIEIAGFSATQIEGTTPVVIALWEHRVGDTGSWHMHAGQRVRFIIVETPAGSMIITIAAAIDEFDDFLPTAEEILAGISFPDLN